MPIVEFTFAALPRDPRLEAQVADHATSAAPAWLWSADGSQILWANAIGAAIFGAGPAACSARRFDSKHPAAVEIMRLVETLPPPGQMRLERLRGFGGSFGRAVTCLCSRVAPDNCGAIFLVATDPVGPALPLRERVSRLFRGTPPSRFWSSRLTASSSTQRRRRRRGLRRYQSASALGPALFNQALTAGSATGASPYGNVTIERFGTDTSAVLIADFDTQPSAGSVADPVAANGASAASHRRDEPAAERRHPLRFVWQMDTEGRFVVGSDEFMELMGPRTTAAFGRLWREIAADLKLDPDGQIARAVATHETWSGITVLWPVDDGGERLPVELSGLPAFDRDRLFRGYRGFGVCRDLDRINHLARARRELPIGFMAPPQAAGQEAGAIAAEPEPPIAVESATGENAADATPYEPAAITLEQADSEAPAPAERPSIADHPSITMVPAAANVVPFPHRHTARYKGAGAQSGRTQGIPRIGGGIDGAAAGRARGFG